MLWIIISVASVFVVVTSILGFVVYRRRQARLRERAARAEQAPRAVTEIELDDVESLPYVERVQDEAGSAALPVAQSLTVVPSRTTSPRAASRTPSVATGLTLRTHDEAGSDHGNDDSGDGGEHHARHNEESYVPGAGHSPVMQGHVRRVTGADGAADSAGIPVATASLTCLPSLVPLRLASLEQRSGGAAAGRYRTDSDSSVDSSGGGGGDDFMQPAFSSWTFQGAAAAVEEVEDSHDEADGVPRSPRSDGSLTPRAPYQGGDVGGGGGAIDGRRQRTGSDSDADDHHLGSEDDEDEDVILALALSLSMQHEFDGAERTAGGGTGGASAEAVVPSAGAAPSELHCVEDDIVQLHDPGDDEEEEEEDAQSEATADIASESDEDEAADGGAGFRAW